MANTMKAVVLTGKGGLEKLEVQDLPMPVPRAGEVLVKVLACGCGATDLTMRKGWYMFAPKYPFVIGYEAVGMVERVGEGVKDLAPGDKVAALLVHGGNGEFLVRAAKEFVKIPSGLDDAEVVALILNYVTAYQMIHRKAHLKPGQTALVTGASGGCGLALLELLRLNQVKTYASCSESKFDVVKTYGATPLKDARSGVTVDVSLRAVLPEGVDASFDCVGGRRLWDCVYATKRGGSVVAYGFAGTVDPKTGMVSSAQSIRGILSAYFSNLWMVKGTFYGITADYRKDHKPFREDFLILCDLLQEGKIKPVIHERLHFFESAKAQQMLEKGGVSGKIVLVKSE